MVGRVWPQHRQRGRPLNSVVRQQLTVPDATTYEQVVIPYRMQAVNLLNIATRYVMHWDRPQPMEIRFNGKVAVEGLSTGFTNPAIESGIIHCRALLEFLGLRGNKNDPAKLSPRQGRQPDDFVIEDFHGPNGPLEKVTVEQALRPYDGPKEEAERALAAVIHCANKAIAHMTTGYLFSLGDIELYEIASRGVPTLVANYFYVARGKEPPKYEFSKRKRAAV
jgi:hypothetical protein